MGKSNKRTKPTVKTKTIIGAIDIGKDTHHSYFRIPQGPESGVFAFPNTRKGFEHFLERMQAFTRRHGGEGAIVGFESTGPYAEPLIHYLKNRGIQLVQINPMHTKRVKELPGNSPLKTDKKDPRIIASVIELGCCLSLMIPTGPAAELRRLTQARERAVKAKNGCRSQLHALFAVLFPECEGVMKGLDSKSALHLERTCPTPEKITRLGTRRLSRMLHRVSRGKLGEERARALVEAAKNSMGVKEGVESMVVEIRHLVREMENQDRFLKELEARMKFWLERVSFSRNMRSLRGIGTITAAGLIGEVGDFRNFSTISEITKLAGLDLYEISSGNHKGERRISKRGRSLMRKLLYYAALNMVRRDGVMRECYEKMRERGMVKKKALVAISRKVLRILFALVRDDTRYEKGEDALKRAA